MALAAVGAAAWCLAVATGCKEPVVGEPTQAAQAAGGPEVRITAATIDGTGHVVASLSVTQGGVAVPTTAALRALKPQFTLAALSKHPVDGLAAWKSLLLTGAQTIPALPPGGPGTPAGAVLANVRQPGAESSGTLAGKDAEFTYTFANALPAGFDGGETLRVGVWLSGDGTRRGTSTFDFRPAGGAPAPRDTVLDANCDRCHGADLVSPHGVAGVKMCVTCHTWQNADPDTTDPAALDPASAATDPNPLDFGRMVHRIHRGKNLPTLYTSRSTEPALPLPAAPLDPAVTSPPPPFARPFFPGTNAPIPGRKYSIVGAMSHEVTFGKIVTRTDNGITPGKVVAAGVVFPRDLRDCDVCHDGAPQEYEVLYAVSRRTCSGCHPEIWFAPPNPDGTTSIADTVHFAHPGGPQASDGECRGCHVAATATQRKVYAPIGEIHVPPYLSARANDPVFEIVAVKDLAPGAAPTVVFKLRDQVGAIVPSPSAPVPPNDTRAPGSPLPRAFSAQYPSGRYLAIAIAGPTSPDYSTLVISSAAGNPDIYTLTADPATGAYTYTFASKIPDTARGTWTVAMEGYRRSYAPSPLYDPAPVDEFRWPYTGEPLAEAGVNPMVDVDTAIGTWTPASPGKTVRRRTVVTQERCERCHGRLALHGGMRNRVEHCVDCHAPATTDFDRRPKVNGNVNLAATYDGVEERSVHFKVLIHRIHTGGRSGSAALDAIEPHVVYGYGGTPYFLDEGEYPNALRDCTACHEGRTYLVEAVPADAAPTLANETGTIRHAGSAAHVAGEPAVPPIQAACLGCHATGATRSHVGRNTVAGVEQCASCHVRGAQSVDVAHGLAPPGSTPVAASLSAIAEKILVPRCATAACHGGSPPAAFPPLDAAAAYDALVGVPSQQVSMKLVEPFEPAKSYLVVKLRNEAGAVGGIGTPMPIGDALLDASDVAAIEAWIANGAPND